MILSVNLRTFLAFALKGICHQESNRKGPELAAPSLSKIFAEIPLTPESSSGGGVVEQTRTKHQMIIPFLDSKVAESLCDRNTASKALMTEAV